MLQKLYTPEGEKMAYPAWQVYPRPQMVRNSYVNLNGPWEFTSSTESTIPEEFPMTIQVPFCPESLLSGIEKHFPDGDHLFYHRKFTLPENFNKGRVLLHIGAADQILKCYVNSKEVGTHEGGYEAMTFDITDALEEENELVLDVVDDLRSTRLPYGKQVLNRGGMWYTPVSGIWQTVWLESVPETYIRKLHIENRGYSVKIATEPALEGSLEVAGLGNFSLEGGCVTIDGENLRHWSPEDPYLYTFTVRCGEDTVESYFAVRSLEIKVIHDMPRLCLNGRPYFFHGLLDQGYWSDGIYTPAAPECYAWDILEMKKLGFNTLRKHIKVEPEEFYYQCDKLGMIVFQDMVNNGDYDFFRDTALPTACIQRISDKKLHTDPDTRKAFLDGMTATVKQLKNHPSIVYWTIFNEAWGQFHADSVYPILKELDDTRFIDSTSGWFRQKKTDVDSRHIYFGPWGQLRRSDKPLVLSEFGGYCYAYEGHLFNPDKAYGYRNCKSLEALAADVEKLYREKIIPAVKKGLCAAIYTQVSDVEDEINGIVTYDRKVVKLSAEPMEKIARDLQKAIRE